MLVSTIFRAYGPVDAEGNITSNTFLFTQGGFDRFELLSIRVDRAVNDPKIFSAAGAELLGDPANLEATRIRATLFVHTAKPWLCSRDRINEPKDGNIKEIRPPEAHPLNSRICCDSDRADFGIPTRAGIMRDVLRDLEV